jgi:hypothetical protein
MTTSTMLWARPRLAKQNAQLAQWILAWLIVANLIRHLQSLKF